MPTCLLSVVSAQTANKRSRPALCRRGRALTPHRQGRFRRNFPTHLGFSEGRQSTRCSRWFALPRRSAVVHHDQFPRPKGEWPLWVSLCNRDNSPEKSRFHGRRMQLPSCDCRGHNGSLTREGLMAWRSMTWRFIALGLFLAASVGFSRSALAQYSAQYTQPQYSPQLQYSPQPQYNP
jgi:hypothetical protein